MDDGDDGLVQVAGRAVEGQDVQVAGHLQSQAVVAEDDEGNEGGGHAEGERAEDDLPDGAATGDVTHEERRGHAPDHPVGPIEDRPVLCESGIPERVGVGAQSDEILQHVAHGGEACFQDVDGAPAEYEDVGQEGAEEDHAQVGEEFDAAHSVDDGIGVQRAGGEEDAERKDFGRVDAEQVGEGGPEERGGEGERRRGAGDQGEDGQDVDQLAGGLVRPAAQQGAAGFGELLLGHAADMDHEAETCGQHGVEAPRDGAPVEEGIGGGPILHGTQGGDPGFLGVKHPFAERIEEDVGGQARREQHAAPGPEAVGGLFAGLAQDNTPDGGEGRAKGQRQHAQSDDQVVDAEAVFQKRPDGFQDGRGPIRRNQENGAAQQDDEQGHHGGERVDDETEALPGFFGGHFFHCICSCFSCSLMNILARAAKSRA